MPALMSDPLPSPMAQSASNVAASQSGATSRSSPPAPVKVGQEPQLCHQEALRRSPVASPPCSAPPASEPAVKKRASLTSLTSVENRTPPRSPVMTSRRSSSNMLASKLASDTVGLIPEDSEVLAPPPSAAQIIRERFRKELEAQISSQTSTQKHPKTLVMLHDACYGHRFSRPRTSRAALSTVVERPERILATVLGLASAYVRLGGRYGGSANAPRAGKSTDSIPFKIQKSTRRAPLISSTVTNVHGSQWMAELTTMCEAAEAKLAMGGKELARPTKAARDHQLEQPKLHEGDLYLCAESLAALEGSLGAVLDAVDAVFSASGPERAFVSVRPPGHHCSADHPSGFCWVNNVHVGISHAAEMHGLTHAAIIDFDLHHGDGSQCITWAHNSKVASAAKNAMPLRKVPIGYYSLHDINSYPCEWGDEEKVRSASLCIDNAHGQSIWNVHLQPWKTDAEFWHLYETRYRLLLDKARAFLRLNAEHFRAPQSGRPPRAAIFISAGFDASEWESQGMQRHAVNVPTDFYVRITRDIVDLALEDGLSVDGRVISVLEGGYSDRALMSGVLSHLCGLASDSSDTLSSPSATADGQDLAQQFQGLQVDEQKRVNEKKLAEKSNATTQPVVDSAWWAPTALEEIELLVNPPTALKEPRKPKGPFNPTYTTPTQSSTAKVVSPPAGRRSFSGTLLPSRSSSGATLPLQAPADEVEISWALAAHELSKLLIPDDRTTRSCLPEELNAEATKVRRKRQSAIGVAIQTPGEDEKKRMQLRERGAKSAVKPVHEEPTQESKIKKSTRRRTMADATELAKEANESVEPLPLLPSGQINRNPPENVSNEPSFGDNTQAPKPVLPTEPPPKRTSRSPTKPRPTRGSGKASDLVTSHASKPLVTDSSRKSPVSKTKAGTNTPDVDALTAKVKKMSIKLNMPKKEPSPVAESQPSTAMKPAKHSETPKPSKSPTKAKSEKTLQPSASNGNVKSTAVLPAPSGNIDLKSRPHDFANGMAPERATAVTTQVPGPDTTRMPAEPRPPNVMDISNLVSAAHDRQPNQSTQNAIENATTRPPSSGKPTSPAVRSRADLPVFTATSPIVFGPPRNGPQGGPAKNDSSNANLDPSQQNTSLPKPESDLRSQHMQSTPTRPATSVWDVPETPKD